MRPKNDPVPLQKPPRIQHFTAEAIWTLSPGDTPPARFPDGIIFHTFYHQPQAGLALEKIARAYEVDPRPSPRDTALQTLTGKTALLVLDGAETVNRLGMYYAAVAESESAKGLPGYASLDGRRAHIVAVQAAALKAEQWGAVQQITWNARDYLNLQGYWTDRITVVQAGLDAARAAGDRYDEGAFLTEQV